MMHPTTIMSTTSGDKNHDDDYYHYNNNNNNINQQEQQTRATTTTYDPSGSVGTRTSMMTAVAEGEQQEEEQEGGEQQHHDHQEYHHNDDDDVVIATSSSSSTTASSSSSIFPQRQQEQQQHNYDNDGGGVGIPAFSTSSKQQEEDQPSSYLPAWCCIPYLSPTRLCSATSGFCSGSNGSSSSNSWCGIIGIVFGCCGTALLCLNTAAVVFLVLAISNMSTKIQVLQDEIVADEDEIKTLQNEINNEQHEQIEELTEKVNDNHSLTLYQMAGTFTLLTCLLTMFHISTHLRNFYEPTVQSKIVTILWMSPIYSITSFLSLVFASADGYLAIIKDLYESYVIYTFLAFLIAVLGRGNRDIVVDILSKHADHLENPSKCFINRMYHHQNQAQQQQIQQEEAPPLQSLPSAQQQQQQNSNMSINDAPYPHNSSPSSLSSSPQTTTIEQYDQYHHKIKANAVLLECQVLAMQFVLVRPITSILSFLATSAYNNSHPTGPTPEEQDDRWSYFKSPNFYISMITNVSVFFAFRGLLKFYHAVNNDLKWCQPFSKFMAIKGVVFLTFWQGLMITILVNLGNNNNNSTTSGTTTTTGGGTTHHHGDDYDFDGGTNAHGADNYTHHGGSGGWNTTTMGHNTLFNATWDGGDDQQGDNSIIHDDDGEDYGYINGTASDGSGGAGRFLLRRMLMAAGTTAMSTMSENDDESNNNDSWFDTDNHYNSPHERAAQIQNFLICLEMLFFTICHWCVFPADEWEPGYRPKEFVNPGIGLKDFASDMNYIIKNTARGATAAGGGGNGGDSGHDKRPSGRRRRRGRGGATTTLDRSRRKLQYDDVNRDETTMTSTVDTSLGIIMDSGSSVEDGNSSHNNSSSHVNSDDYITDRDDDDNDDDDDMDDDDDYDDESIVGRRPRPRHDVLDDPLTMPKTTINQRHHHDHNRRQQHQHDPMSSHQGQLLHQSAMGAVVVSQVDDENQQGSGNRIHDGSGRDHPLQQQQQEQHHEPYEDDEENGIGMNLPPVT